MRRIASLMMLAGAFSALVLMFMRLGSVISFGEPYHVVTSGFEEESLYAMWKWLHGVAIYTDPHAIPFSASYFNWLYYAIYGSVIKMGIEWLGIGEEWIPTLGRLLTFGILLGACCLNTRLLSKPGILRYPLPLPHAFSLSVLVWLGPLIGFWAMTVRPDGLALCFDLIAAYAFLKYYPASMRRAILLAALACYLSWACKQVNIVMPGAIGLFLLTQRQYLAMLVFGTLMSVSYGLTLVLANEAMLNMLLFKGTAIPFSFDVFQGNVINFLKKSVPAWFLLALLTVKQPQSQDNVARLGWCGLLVWALTLLPASSKVGSADNYHFIAMMFMGFIVASKLGTVTQLYANRVLVASGALYVLMVGVALKGPSLAGLSSQHQQNLALKACISQQEPPVFIMNHYGALPWMNTQSPTFMLAYNYWFDRQRHHAFESNGIGGLIEKQYFATLILPSDIEKTFDEASLSHYQKLPDTCVGYSMYIKKEAA
jgi:hypothetical protein